MMVIIPLNFTIGERVIDQCLLPNNHYRADCLYKVLCPQLNDHIIRVGIAIIISHIVLSWLLWWFTSYGYKYLNYNYMQNRHLKKFLGDFREKDTRLYWDVWIRARLTALELGYIAMVVWLSR